MRYSRLPVLWVLSLAAAFATSFAIGAQAQTATPAGGSVVTAKAEAPPQPATAAAAPAQTEAQIAASNTAIPSQFNYLERGGWAHFWERYTPANIGLPDLANNNALERQAASGTLSLSLHQVLQMALASDLDVADAAYAQLLAVPDYLRTLAGGSARGTSGQTISSALFSGALGSNASGGGNSGGTAAGSATGGGTGVFGGCNGCYDPTLNVSFGDEHVRTPLANSTLFGTSVEILNRSSGSVSFGQGFTTGTSYSISGGALRSFQNSEDLFFNPQVSSEIGVGLQQELLAGGNRAANRASIVIGLNGLKFADAAFRMKIINVTAQAAEQYWGLVGAGKQLSIAQEAEGHAQETLDDTNQMIDLGKVPASNRVQAEAALSATEQARISSQSDYDKAASKLKSYLVKQWTMNVIHARVMASDELPSPVAAVLPSTENLVSRAVNESPLLAQDRINLNNNELAVTVRKNGMLPALALFASYTSSGVSGVGVNCTVAVLPCPAADTLPPTLGGFSQSFGQIFSYKAPDYGVGFALSVPVFNRLNRADEATAELQVAQQRVDLQKDTNTVSEQVNEDRITLASQGDQLAAAQKAIDQQQQNVADLREKYRDGRATLDDVIVGEVALVNAQRTAVTVQMAYATAMVELAKDSGTLLDDYHIVLPNVKQISPHNLP